MTLANRFRAFKFYYSALDCASSSPRDEERLVFFNTIAGRIVQDIQPNSVLDVGCGSGLLVEGLRNRNVEAFGMDISEQAIEHVHESIKSYCSLGSMTEPFSQRYDLIVAIEILERNSKVKSEKAIANFCQHTDDVLFTYISDYTDTTNFNVQSPEYWAEQFARHGFYRDVDFDASFIDPWAVRFRKISEPFHRVLRDYERSYVRLARENRDLRASTREMRERLAQSVEQEVIERALQAEVDFLVRQVNDLSNQIVKWHDHWTSVQSGMTWRLLQAAIRMQPTLAPGGSRREKLFHWFFDTIRGVIRKHRGEPPEPIIKTSQDKDVSGDTVPAPVAAAPSETKYLKLVIYTPDPWTSACAHLRAIGPAYHEGAGIQILEGTRWQDDSPLVFPDEADAVLVQRNFPGQTELYERVVGWARSNGKPIIYELDDLLIELPEEHPERDYYADERVWMLQALMDADAVIVSTVPLAEYARRFNANVWVLPNYLDDRIWKMAQKASGRKSSPVVIGYMGGVTKTHIPDLALITPVFLRLLRRYRDKISLRFWGVLPPELEDHPNVEFRVEKFPSYIEFAQYFSRQNSDIFVAPLCNNLFNRCKSPIKFIEYSALGIPGVYSRIAPYEGVVVHCRMAF